MASLLVHGALLALLVAKGDQLWNRAFGPDLGAFRGGAQSGSGGGGPRVSYITLPPVEKPEAPRISKPTLTRPPQPVVAAVKPDPEPVKPLPLDTAAHATAETTATQVASDTTAGTGSGTGRGTQVGMGEGSGPAGEGAGSGPGGGGGRARPPEPRDMAFPFDNPPKELRGISLNVTFWVRVDGKVDRYLVDPEIKDRDYAKKFDEVMRAFRFDPARAPDGTKIPGTTRISFTLPGKSSS
jgi:hypothetical protein